MRRLTLFKDGEGIYMYMGFCHLEVPLGLRIRYTVGKDPSFFRELIYY